MAVYRVKIITDKGIVIPTNKIIIQTIGNMKIDDTNLKLCVYEIPKLVLDGTLPSTDPDDRLSRDEWEDDYE